MSVIHENHYPVLLNEVIEALNPQDGACYIDATFGGGGYARAILNHAQCNLVGLDRDPDALERARLLQKEYGERFSFYQGCFGDIDQLVPNKKYDGIVFDLGVSSYQIDQADRGFSFRFEGPLDMRMTPTGITAAEVVNTYSEKDLADIIYHYGEEHASRKVAHAIVTKRKIKPFETTSELAETIRSVVHRTRDIDPATLTFQALRIFVNNELIEVDTALKKCLNLLTNNGKVVVVSFHALEDRVIKSNFKNAVYTMETGTITYRVTSSKAVKPTLAEVKSNPRSRSAKLRSAQTCFLGKN